MVLDVEKNLFFKPLVGHQKKVVSVLFIPNSNTEIPITSDDKEDDNKKSDHIGDLVSASEDCKLKIWDMKLGDCVATL